MRYTQINERKSVMAKRIITALLIILFICGISSTALAETRSGVVTVEVDLSAQAQANEKWLGIGFYGFKQFMAFQQGKFIG